MKARATIAAIHQSADKKTNPIADRKKTEYTGWRTNRQSNPTGLSSTGFTGPFLSTSFCSVWARTSCHFLSRPGRLLIPGTAPGRASTEAGCQPPWPERRNRLASSRIGPSADRYPIAIISSARSNSRRCIELSGGRMRTSGRSICSRLSVMRACII